MHREDYEQMKKKLKKRRQNRNEFYFVRRSALAFRERKGKKY